MNYGGIAFCVIMAAVATAAVAHTWWSERRRIHTPPAGHTGVNEPNFPDEHGSESTDGDLDWKNVGKVSPSREVASSLVYQKLQLLIEHVSGLSVWLSKNYDPSYWNPRLDAIQADIDRVKKWTETNTSGVIRDEYRQWIKNYFQVGVDDARTELRTQKQRKEMDEYYRRNREHSDAIQSFQEKNQFPSPPEEER